MDIIERQEPVYGTSQQPPQQPLPFLQQLQQSLLAVAAEEQNIITRNNITGLAKNFARSDACNFEYLQLAADTHQIDFTHPAPRALFLSTLVAELLKIGVTDGFVERCNQSAPVTLPPALVTEIMNVKNTVLPTYRLAKDFVTNDDCTFTHLSATSFADPVSTTLFLSTLKARLLKTGMTEGFAEKCNQAAPEALSSELVTGIVDIKNLILSIPDVARAFATNDAYNFVTLQTQIDFEFPGVTEFFISALEAQLNTTEATDGFLNKCKATGTTTLPESLISEIKDLAYKIELDRDTSWIDEAIQERSAAPQDDTDHTVVAGDSQE